MQLIEFSENNNIRVKLASEVLSINYCNSSSSTKAVEVNNLLACVFLRSFWGRAETVIAII
jgi:tRNA splicing ligase